MVRKNMETKLEQLSDCELLEALDDMATQHKTLVAKMVAQMEAEAFGSCTNFRECEAVCPKEISIDFIALLNRDYLKAKRRQLRLSGQKKY